MNAALAAIASKIQCKGLTMKYLLTHILLLISIFCLGQELAPALISAAGDSYANDQVQLSWTLGGSVLDSYESGDITLSSGVQSEEVNPFVLGLGESHVNVQVYPNPVKDLLSLQFDVVGDFRIMISDLTGRTVHFENIQYASAQVLNVSHLGIGAYLLQVLDQNSEPIKKFKLSKTR